MDSYPVNLLDAFIDQIDLGIIVLDDQLRICHWNSFISQRSGKNLQQAQGRDFVEVFPEANGEHFVKVIELARERAKHVYSHWLDNLPLVELSGDCGEHVRQLQSTLFFPFKAANGERHFGLVMYDTSAIAKTSEHLEAALKALNRKQSEQEQLLRKLETANSQLLQSEKLAAIGQLAAGVAHEINNPIGYVFSNLKTLDGYVRDLLKIADAVDSAADLDELRQLKRNLEYDYIRGDVEALVNESEDGIDRVKRIISALKDFSHIEEEEFRPADLHRGLDTTLNVVNNELKYKAEVVKEYGVLAEVECIPSQINQVVMNLLVNAAHAIEQFGRITLRTGGADDWAWIEVEDTGKGIDAKTLNRIFEPFFTTKPVGKGTGLGLALSYSIVQKHNGRIEVDSTPGLGTRFRVWLPVRQPAPAPQQDAPPA
ncbi:ATP-binding protein [Pseudomonas sp. NPDC077186]|uniref:ATP-binding protein n=1 Tax=Pseudomonas sp. NPDC077186 TaxID=3364421 RepID=UPI0037CAA572